MAGRKEATRNARGVRRQRSLQRIVMPHAHSWDDGKDKNFVLCGRLVAMRESVGV